MSIPQKFRSSFNGFNREDVANYLEYLNSKHTAEVNQLTSEADFLRSKLDSVQPEAGQREALSALQQERDSFRTQLEALQMQYDTLLAQYEALQAHCAGLEQNQVNAAPAAGPVCSPAEELEIYRRAERTERMARERADLVYRQTNGILNEASVRVNEMAEQVVPIADQILMQLTQLQNTVSTTKQSLQDAVVIINTLRPESN